MRHVRKMLKERIKECEDYLKLKDKEIATQTNLKKAPQKELLELRAELNKLDDQ